MARTVPQITSDKLDGSDTAGALALGSETASLPAIDTAEGSDGCGHSVRGIELLESEVSGFVSPNDFPKESDAAMIIVAGWPELPPMTSAF